MRECKGVRGRMKLFRRNVALQEVRHRSFIVMWTEGLADAVPSAE